MNAIPVSENEEGRIAALKLYNILDTAPEREFDDLTKLACEICRTPIALISLTDENRQWFKSTVGIDIRETPRELSFCQYTILSDEIFEVTNPLTDTRFSDNPLVIGYPNVRFYAGAPLINKDGFRLGTLCVVNHEPHSLNDSQRSSLKILARSVVSLLELRLEKHELYNNAPCGYHSVDADGYFIEINDTELKWLGYTRDEVIGKMSVKDILVYPDGKSSFEDEFDSLKIKGFKKDQHRVFKCKGGRVINTLANIIAVYDDNGVFSHTRSTLYDISELKIMQHRLEDSEAQYRNIVEESAQMIFTADLEGYMTYASTRFRNAIGYSSGDIDSKWFAFIFDDEWREQVTKFYEEQYRTNITESTMIFPIKNKDGEKMWVEQVAALIRDDNGVIGLRCSLYDVTERTKTQDAMKEATRLAMEAKDMQQNFLGRMSHEIRTPMNGVVGMVDLLYTTMLSNEQKVFVAGIKESAVNMLRILNDILDITKIESGKLVFEDTDFDLRHLVESVLFSLKADADEKNIKLVSNIDKKIPASVIADPGRLNQVLMNLAGNALKFTEKGSVTISVLPKEINNDLITLDFIIRDTGIGISEDKINTIFESFAQAETHTARKYGGSGLGLTIARQLIEQQHGDIRVESKLGMGSTFSFTFHVKANRNPAKKSNEISTSFVPLTGYNVLLVEDNIMNQQVGMFSIQKRGARVTIADSGKYAIELLRKNKYDIILMDLQMPEMNGVQTTAIIREELKDDTPIMAMTASAMKGEKERCIAAGMNDYISKPFNPVELNRKIYALVNRPKIVTTERIINTDYLKSITRYEIPVIRRLLDIYITKTPGMLDKLDACIAAGKFDLVKGEIHNLKNSAGLIGADGLYSILTTIELNLVELPPKNETIDMIASAKEMIDRSLKEVIEERKSL